MARRIGRWKIWSILAVVFVCYLAAEIALSTTTPGPALGQVWRWVVAGGLTGATLCVWAIVYAVRNERAASRGDGD